MLDFISERINQILFASWQHFSLVVQCLILATVVAVVLATLVYRKKAWCPRRTPSPPSG